MSSLYPDMSKSKFANVKNPKLRPKLGPAVKIGMLLALLAGGYVTWVVSQPYFRAYMVKTALARACNELFKERIEGTPSPETPQVRAFLTEAKANDVLLNQDQYDFHIVGKKKEAKKCTGQAAFDLRTRWRYVEDVIRVAPMRTIHRVRVDLSKEKGW